MRNYDRANVQPPKDIERKRAHIVGGGIAGFATAAFLIDDAHMPAENITIYEAEQVHGGCLDAHRFEKGYRNRGSRMWERRYECTYYLLGKIPSIDNPALTLHDETFQANMDHPFHARMHLMHNRGQKYLPTGPLMSKEDGEKMINLLLSTEQALEGLTVEQWFGPGFFKSDFWFYWAYIFALAPHHSAIECRRYLRRFAMYLGESMIELTMLIHTKYNEYDSVIHPMEVWLEKKGVHFQKGTAVRDIETENKGKETLATALVYDDASGRRQRKPLTRDDLVFFTNGSMVTKTTWGDNDTVVAYDRDTKDLGLFDVWKKLAARDPKFGRPEPFISDIEGSGFYTWTATIKGDRTFIDYWSAKTGVKQPLLTNAFSTAKDANWVPTSFVYGTDYYRGQPADVNICHGYLLWTDRPGNFIKKTVRECTGKEIFTEILYHFGLNEDQIKKTIEHSYVSVAAMPYITSQFMPRRVADRPEVIPEGCVNLAFIGQYVETPGDVSFTVESSVRTAMMAVWGLTGLQKPQIPMYEPLLDVRVIARALAMAAGRNELTMDILDNVKGTTGETTAKLLNAALKKIPEPAIF
ncbi:MAG TPA: oleate hydratase [Verrucomicrobiae bacterium]|nr:oleate hydratase [Verrucomicrobiae bacterium]